MNISGKELIALGWESGPVVGQLIKIAANWKDSEENFHNAIALVKQTPEDYLDDEVFGEVAQALSYREPETLELMDAVPYKVWGKDGIQSAALDQMHTACRLPVAVRGAQMPDGHVGYGLPIGGVLATRNAVIPYAVGVDICCRMHLSVTDLPANRLEGNKGRLLNALKNETAFGMGSNFSGTHKRDHDVMDDEDWNDVPRNILYLKDKAWSQLGSSGSGNHFVEWGILEVKDDDEFELDAGEYVALLSHSGSRGFGANIANTYTKIAMELCNKLPKEAKHLAWLDTRSNAGQEYWLAMNLAGKYAKANHECIHRHVLKAAGLKQRYVVQNHHNFAWLETYNDEELVVHRKGATPAGKGELGIIPGSMADPGFIVRGKGNLDSLNSASHGAGRNFGRREALRKFTKSQMKKLLAERGVELLAGGLDEAPFVYKNIRDVMKAQNDLVETIAEFHPRYVLMADDGKSED